MKKNQKNNNLKTNLKRPLRIKKHSWDETLVIVVMVFSALCVLALFATSVSTVGKAYSAVPTQPDIFKMLGDAEIVHNTSLSLTNCNLVCGKVGKTCILARSGENLIRCSGRFKGEYYCSCAVPERLI